MRRCVYAILGSSQLLRAKKPKSAQRKNPTDTRYMKSSWPRPRACVPAKGAHWSRFLAILWPGGAKPAEVGPLVLPKTAPSAATYRPGEGNRRWERLHSPRHSPAHPQRQCFCPLACDLLRFIPGIRVDLGWDHWFYPEVVQIRTKYAICLEITFLAGLFCRIWPFYGLIWAFMGFYGFYGLMWPNFLFFF